MKILNENDDNYDDSDEENDVVISNDMYKNLLEQNHPMLKENNLFEIKNKTVNLRQYAEKYECDVTSYCEENDNIIINCRNRRSRNYYCCIGWFYVKNLSPILYIIII